MTAALLLCFTHIKTMTSDLSDGTDAASGFVASESLANLKPSPVSPATYLTLSYFVFIFSQ